MGWYAAAGWALVFAVPGVSWALGGTVGLGTLSPGIQKAAVARDRALLAARDVAILKAAGMSPRQLLAMVMTASAVLGVIGGLFALPLGVRTYQGLMTQLVRQVGNRPPPFAFDVLHPTTRYPLGVMGLAVASPARPVSCPSSRPQPGRRDPAIGVRQRAFCSIGPRWPQ